MERVVFTPEVEDVVLTILEGLSCPRSLQVAILVRYRDWDQLVTIKADPSQYAEPEDYWRAVQATDLLRKNPDLETTIDRRSAAKEKFFEAERQCCLTNLRLDPLLWGRSDPTYDVALHDFVSRVRKIIKSWIGDRPPNTWEGAFGPGATMSDSAKASTVADKLSSVPTYTENSWPYLVPWSGTWWATACAAESRGPIKTRGNSFFTVLKDATIDRGCAKEPSINSFYQLGLGRILRKLLSRAGFDLVSGWKVHRSLAKHASKYGDFATIDLTSASDTSCNNLVVLLLPTGWSEPLCGLRSPFTKVDSDWIRLEKFSSMGNGFTFELETLLFAAIAKACDEKSIPGRDLFVYGDDIIVRTHRASTVLSALAFFGFSPNKRKTFLEGEFRESCGGDFFRGVGVRAYSLKEIPHEPQQWIALANGLRRSCYQSGADHRARWSSLRRSWFKVLDLVPASIRRLRGPVELGDICIHDDEARWVQRWSCSIREVKCYRPVGVPDVRWEGYTYNVQFAAALYGVSSLDNKGHVHDFISRNAVTGYKVGWVACS